MSLDIYLEEVQPCIVFEANITHNLGKIAVEAHIYRKLWRPKEARVKCAGQLIKPLERAIKMMKADPARFKRHDSPNGWGLYIHFLPWLEELLAACREHPDATVKASI
jgi:hypothetical protein